MEFEHLNPRQFDQFCDFIYKESGIRIDERKVTLLSNRIRRRLKAGNFPDFDVYYKFLTSAAGADELAGFLDAITTNETFFFRTEKHFDWLRNEFVPELLQQQRAGKRSASLRIWSAGCASGAEAYTIAICLAEESFRLRDWSLHILGTDISEDALREAREGVYKQRSIEGVSEKQLRRHFRTVDADRWQVRDEIRELVEFQKHNLMTPLEQPKFDCIFIRNVLIYFDRQSKQTVIDHLLNSLVPGGYLVVGPSEGIFDMLGSLRRISPLLYQKADETLQRAGGRREV